MRLFFVVIGFKVKRYKNRGAFKFPCHCEPQARQSPGIKYVILSVSEISHDLSDKAYTSALTRWDSSLRSE